VKKRERERTSDIRESRDSEALLRSADRLRPVLDTQIAAIVNRVGPSPPSVQVRELGYRWGSCGHKGDLYFHAPCGDATASDD
jgi:predicted metal-dependent hydrolase